MYNTSKKIEIKRPLMFFAVLAKKQNYKWKHKNSVNVEKNSLFSSHQNTGTMKNSFVTSCCNAPHLYFCLKLVGFSSFKVVIEDKIPMKLEKLRNYVILQRVKSYLLTKIPK